MPLGKRLEAIGYRGDRLPLSLWEQPKPADSLALVFPGFGYHADLPVLYYPALQLAASGADVLRLEYHYNDQPGFMRQPDEDLRAWLGSDAAAVLEAGLEHHAYRRFILVGKSLGTISMAALLGQKPELASSPCVWLTPVMDNPSVLRQLREAPNPGLLAIGAADGFYDPQVIDELKRRNNLRCLVFPSADHSLEVSGEAQVAVRYMAELLTAIENLVQH